MPDFAKAIVNPKAFFCCRTNAEIDQWQELLRVCLGRTLNAECVSALQWNIAHNRQAYFYACVYDFRICNQEVSSISGGSFYTIDDFFSPERDKAEALELHKILLVKMNVVSKRIKNYSDLLEIIKSRNPQSQSIPELEKYLGTADEELTDVIKKLEENEKIIERL